MACLHRDRRWLDAKMIPDVFRGILKQLVEWALDQHHSYLNYRPVSSIWKNEAMTSFMSKHWKTCTFNPKWNQLLHWTIDEFMTFLKLKHSLEHYHVSYAFRFVHFQFIIFRLKPSCLTISHTWIYTYRLTRFFRCRYFLFFCCIVNTICASVNYLLIIWHSSLTLL